MAAHAREDCCSSEPTSGAPRSAADCPACGGRGKPVPPVTIESLVAEEALGRLARTDGFRFCDRVGCDLAYFHPETGEVVGREEVRVAIGQKETSPGRTLCYCFGHTAAEVEAQVAAEGDGPLADEIGAKCKQGLARCEETNPQGTCCLGNVRRAIAEARERVGRPAADDGPARDAGRWASGAAVLSAVLSSACCWLPLLLILFGASAAGVAGFFEAYRPLLLAVTAVLLATGFYFLYLRGERCAPGTSCAVPNPKRVRFNKLLFWSATLVAAAFAFFPSYVGTLVAGASEAETAAAASAGELSFEIEGMTCAGCASALQLRLASLPGVERAVVDFESGRATIRPASGPSVEAILAAVADQGFEARIADDRR